MNRVRVWKERLGKLLDKMDVPFLRKGLTFSDIRWLSRNLSIRNSDHPDFPEARRLLVKLQREYLKRGYMEVVGT